MRRTGVQIREKGYEEELRRRGCRKEGYGAMDLRFRGSRFTSRVRLEKYPLIVP